MLQLVPSEFRAFPLIPSRSPLVHATRMEHGVPLSRIESWLQRLRLDVPITAPLVQQAEARPRMMDLISTREHYVGRWDQDRRNQDNFRLRKSHAYCLRAPILGPSLFTFVYAPPHIQPNSRVQRVGTVGREKLRSE